MASAGARAGWATSPSLWAAASLPPARSCTVQLVALPPLALPPPPSARTHAQSMTRHKCGDFSHFAAGVAGLVCLPGVGLVSMEHRRLYFDNDDAHMVTGDWTPACVLQRLDLVRVTCASCRGMHTGFPVSW